MWRKRLSRLMVCSRTCQRNKIIKINKKRYKYNQEKGMLMCIMLPFSSMLTVATVTLET